MSVPEALKKCYPCFCISRLIIAFIRNAIFLWNWTCRYLICLAVWWHKIRYLRTFLLPRLLKIQLTPIKSIEKLIQFSKLEPIYILWIKKLYLWLSLVVFILLNEFQLFSNIRLIQNVFNSKITISTETKKQHHFFFVLFPIELLAQMYYFLVLIIKLCTTHIYINVQMYFVFI